MNDFDIKTQLDFLQDFLDQEMAKCNNFKFNYFVIKPGSHQTPVAVKDDSPLPMALVTCGNTGTTAVTSYESCHPHPTVTNRPLSTSFVGADESLQVVDRAASNCRKKSRAVDIIDPATGEKIRF